MALLISDIGFLISLSPIASGCLKYIFGNYGLENPTE